MPRSVIDNGFADVVARVEELPARILAYRRHAPTVDRTPESADDKALSGLEKVFVLLRARTGNDFSMYKRSTIQRRVTRRLQLHQIDTVPRYVRYADQ